MSYATVSDFLTFYDSRVVGDLCQDLGVRANLTALTTVGSAPNTVVQGLLDSAAGEISSAVLLGGRYQLTDLTTLTGQDAMFLKRLNADIAFVLLVQRRGQDIKELPQYDRTQALLQQLRLGERVFNVQADIDAGTTQSFFPSYIAIKQVNLVVTQASPSYPGYRPQRTPS